MKAISYGRHWIDESDIRDVVKVLRSGWITQGPKIKEFEDALCRYAGAKYAVVVANGTAALHIACRAAEIGRGDEVITSPITFVASANCISYCDGNPVFADVDDVFANIDPEEIKKAITKNTKGVIPVHYAGQPCDLKAISDIARKRNMIIIEDAAHALGAEYMGSKIGSCRYSDMTIFSFHPVKSITTGEGGAILTNNASLHRRLLMLRNHGISKERFFRKSHGNWYYEMQLLGYNYRLTDIQAALGVSQLKKLDKFIRRREEIFRTYINAFKDNIFFDIPSDKQRSCSAHHLFPIRLKNRYVRRKRKIFSDLRRVGIGVQVHYIPVYLHPYYQNIKGNRWSCPKAEDFYQREISLPIYPFMTEKQIMQVMRGVFDVFEEN